MPNEVFLDQLESLSPEELRRTLVQIRKLPEDPPQENILGCSREDPRDFIRDVLGERPTEAARKYGYVDAWTPQQGDILDSVRVNYRTAVPAGVGTGKCVEEHERLPLSDGAFVPASDLVGRAFGMIAFSTQGTQSPSLAIAEDNGIEEVVRVTTSCGRQVVRTTNHPLYAADLTRKRCIVTPVPVGWLQAADIQVGQAILVPIIHESEGRIRQPDDIVKLLAYLFGDGGITATVTFTQEDGVAKTEFLEIVKRMGCRATPRNDKITVGISGAGPSGSMTAERNPILNLLREVGLYGKKSKDKVFPELVWRLPNDQLALFLNRVFACDGWAYARLRSSQIGISLASEAGIRDIEMAMLRLGVCGRVRQRIMKFPYGGEQRESLAWEWSAHMSGDLRRFQERVGIFGKEAAVTRAVKAREHVETRRTLKWRWVNAPTGFMWDRVVKVESLGKRRTIAIQVQNHATFVSTVVEHNTFLAARIANWWFHRFQPCKVITTAPTWRQVRKLLWSEIHTARDHSVTPLPGRRNDLEIRLAEDHFMLGLATRPETGDISATAFQGFHSPHVLIIFDEATGVPEEIFNAAEGIAVNPDSDRWLLIGNPTDPASRFHDACAATREDGSKLWNVIALDGRQHPNVIHNDPMIVPGAVTKDWVDDRLEEYGSEDAPLFMAKVKGEWPMQASDALIQLAWIVQGQMRWERVREDIVAGTYKDEHRGICAALDVAGEGTDLTVLSFMSQKGWEIPKVNGKRAFHSGRTLDEAVELCCAAVLEYPEIAVLVMDDTGLGQGVSARLRQLQRERKLPGFHKSTEPGKGRSLWIWPIKFGERAVETERFDRMKDQLWWAAREALRRGDVAFPPDETIRSWGLPKGNSPVSQITRPIYGSVNGKIVVWDKRESGLRGGSESLMERIRLLPASSPDVGHSFAMACLGWERLKPGKVVEAVTETQTFFDRKTRKMIDGGRKTRGTNGPMLPWQRRRA